MKIYRLPFWKEIGGYYEIKGKNKKKAIENFENGEYEEFDNKGSEEFDYEQMFDSETLEVKEK